MVSRSLGQQKRETTLISEKSYPTSQHLKKLRAWLQLISQCSKYPMTATT